MSHILPGQFFGMVAFSHTLFGLALHTICTYYTMILGLAPYDFLLRARRKKRTPALSVGGVGLEKKRRPSTQVPGVWRTSAKFGRSRQDLLNLPRVVKAYKRKNQLFLS